MKTLDLTVESRSGSAPLSATIDELVIGGWAGRDKAAMEHHMVELEALGVKRPASTPVFYRVAAARLTTDPVIEDVGANSSGDRVEVMTAGHLIVERQCIDCLKVCTDGGGGDCVHSKTVLRCHHMRVRTRKYLRELHQ